MTSFWRDIGQVIINHTVGETQKLIFASIGELHERLESVEVRMATAEETLDQFATAINDATNQLAERIDRLVQQAGTSPAGSVSSEEIAAKLGPISEGLKKLAADGQPIVPPTDESSNTDPTNSPVAESPVVNPAEDAPTEAPTPDPTVNPVDVNEENLPGSSSNDAAAAGTEGVPAFDANSIPQPQTENTTVPVTSTDSAASSDTNTNDYREDY